jgi:hypothetical protein
VLAESVVGAAVIKEICDVIAKITPRLDFRVMPPIVIRNNETCDRRQMAQPHSDVQQISADIFQATGRVDPLTSQPGYVSFHFLCHHVLDTQDVLLPVMVMA